MFADRNQLLKVIMCRRLYYKTIYGYIFIIARQHALACTAR